MTKSNLTKLIRTADKLHRLQGGYALLNGELELMIAFEYQLDDKGDQYIDKVVVVYKDLVVLDSESKRWIGTVDRTLRRTEKKLNKEHVKEIKKEFDSKLATKLNEIEGLTL